MYNKSNIKKEKKQEIRGNLKKISEIIKPLKDKGEVQTINEGLIRRYEEQGHKNLKTYSEWLSIGRQVKRGSKALYLWRRQTSFTAEENGEEKEIFYYPFLALFSEKQTYKIGG